MVMGCNLVWSKGWLAPYSSDHVAIAVYSLAWATNADFVHQCTYWPVTPSKAPAALSGQHNNGRSSSATNKEFLLKLPSVPRSRGPGVANKGFLTEVTLNNNHNSMIRDSCINKFPSIMAPQRAVFHFLAMCWLLRGPVLRGKL